MGDRWKLKLCVRNSSVVKIYIIRPKPGPVAKNATPNAYHWATEAVADNLGASSVYIYILMRW